MENTLGQPSPLPPEEIAVPKVTDEASLLRQRIAAAIIGVGLLLGLIGNALFFEKEPGISFPFYAILFAAALLGLLWQFRQQVYAHNMAFLLPFVLFAGLIALRSSGSLTFFNLLMLLGALFVVLHFARDPQFIGGDWRKTLTLGIFALIVGWWVNTVETLIAGRGWFYQQTLSEDERWKKLEPILRGLLLTIPIVGVFALLLGSADMIFGDLLSDALGWLIPDEDWIAQGIFIAMLTWLVIAALKLPLLGVSDTVGEILLANKEGKRWLPRLGMIETTMILGSVTLLFLLFVIIQGRYLFGGEANITAQGYTYAEYARRGFWELLAVSVLSMGLILALDTFTQRDVQQERRFQVLVTALIALVFVLLLAAMRRLLLYEDAYGFTISRVMAQIFMVWLGVLFVALWVVVTRQQTRYFFQAAILVALAFVLTLNLINLDSFVAQRNIDRLHTTGKIDLYYLLTLSEDAIPAITTLMNEGRLSENEREQLRWGLGDWLYRLDNAPESRKGVSYHWGKARAWAALDEYREELQAYYAPSRSY